MGSTAGITPDAVRERLRLLGHHDVPDWITSKFLNDLQVEVPGMPDPSTHTHAPLIAVFERSAESPKAVILGEETTTTST